MPKTVKFKGIFPPVSTIFNENGEFSQEEMAYVMDSLIDSGVDGLFFLGTGGEFSQMSVEERKEVAAFTVRYVNNRVPVLIGTGSTSTRETIALSQHAEQVGADGVVIVNPYYWNLSEENLFNYYSDIAQSIELPIILYNFPDRTGQDLTADFVLRLVDQHRNIVGIKETVDSIGHINEMILKVKKQHPNFSVFCGFDNHLLNTLQLGGDGSITASGNFAPELSVGIYQSFLQGDLKKAVSLHKRLSVLPLLYQVDSPFVNVVKEAMRLCGMTISTYVQPPTKPLSEEKIEEVREILELAEVISTTTVR
ncbi:4-hydroxy-tetrahydrodipicolinate synthase [Oceanobacillus halophilus]|uniref:4-hydroxy-tetrahydrodipicolinate synthase n=1 Tax=Oceanobacillus halophilus TaxID=930130 RepID=A0A494ZYR6_9BACI|nr:4-hydroxy-tetrahydrodipicolinate synthase [Oceanobacillus halophilus]RKQ30235.1 4-hydroxy-tetrahydrodipicolinate synthase [Oceanobacillus halophilus]